MLATFRGLSMPKPKSTKAGYCVATSCPLRVVIPRLSRTGTGGCALPGPAVSASGKVFEFVSPPRFPLR